MRIPQTCDGCGRLVWHTYGLEMNGKFVCRDCDPALARLARGDCFGHAHADNGDRCLPAVPYAGDEILTPAEVAAHEEILATKGYPDVPPPPQ